MKKVTTRKLIQFNNGSQRVALPLEFLRELGINAGEDLEIRLEGDEIIIKKGGQK